MVAAQVIPVAGLSRVLLNPLLALLWGIERADRNRSIPAFAAHQVIGKLLNHPSSIAHTSGERDAR